MVMIKFSGNVGGIPVKGYSQPVKILQCGIFSKGVNDNGTGTE
jgi:hypothetical protein